MLYQTLGRVFHQDIQLTPRNLFKTNFSVFGYSDETLFRVFDMLLHKASHKGFAKCSLTRAFYSSRKDEGLGELEIAWKRSLKLLLVFQSFQSVSEILLRQHILR